MSEVLEILQENGLISAERVKEILFRRPMREVLSLREGIRQTLRTGADRAREQQSRASIDTASFLASSSLRGDSGCSRWECHNRKVQALARYGALYCDTIVVPLRLDSFDWEPDESEQRYALARALLGVVELWPLIEAGMAVLIPDDLQLCEQHLRQAVPLRPRIQEVAKGLSRRASKQISVTYHPSKDGGAPFRLDFKGPTYYIEHGQISYLTDTMEAWLSRTVARSRSKGPLRLTETTLKRNGVLSPIFGRIANDVALQEYWGIAYNARYVTDLPAEADFFRTLYHDDGLARETAALCARLNHVVPLLSDVPLESVMKVRNEDAESFRNYRSAVTQIVKNYVRSGKRIGDAEAKEIYTDILLPQLHSLEAAAKNARRSARKKAALKVVATSALLAIGIYTGVLPVQIAEAMKLVGGLKAAQDIAEAIGAIEKNPAEVRNHNLYFLLRLKQKA